ncbi:MAG: pyrimidine-nucleoside phosphorylase [Dehalococcoidia bacterium]|nr:MAG: pyrimidine-nucleoside phosphorylase [Dehalococcoidia bacterium]
MSETGRASFRGRPLRAVDLIAQKAAGGRIPADALRWLVDGYTAGVIPDYQMSAFLMAVCWRGMTDEETTDLTLAMAESGVQLDVSDIAPLVADKHSTGGVGDKTTLVVAPLVAQLGLPVGKMSGRGLGHTGGTLDKLESFPGLRVEMSSAQFRDQLRRIGIVIAGQSADLAPADGKIYALRDATATVENLSLIASSVMAKKIAAGATVIGLDVKCGHGAFMKTPAEAARLADLMIAIGDKLGRRTVAIVSAMDQPLGEAVGNVIEVEEAIATLRGGGPADLRVLAIELTTDLVVAAGLYDAETARRRAEAALDSGAALEKLADLVEVQGGRREDVAHPERLPHAPVELAVFPPRDGVVAAIDAKQVGLLTMQLGAGRAQKGDPIDHRVGIRLLRKIGDPVRRGEPVALVAAATEQDAEAVAPALIACYRFSDSPVAPPPLILSRHGTVK